MLTEKEQFPKLLETTIRLLEVIRYNDSNIHFQPSSAVVLEGLGCTSYIPEPDEDFIGNNTHPSLEKFFISLRWGRHVGNREETEYLECTRRGWYELCRNKGIPQQPSVRSVLAGNINTISYRDYQMQMAQINSRFPPEIAGLDYWCILVMIAKKADRVYHLEASANREVLPAADFISSELSLIPLINRSLNNPLRFRNGPFIRTMDGLYKNFNTTEEDKTV